MSLFGKNDPMIPRPTVEPTLGMKWHKFLIYFALWASAVVNLSSALQYLTGAIYGTDAAYVYAYYDGLSMLDKGMGIFLLGMAIFAIVTRFALAGFKAGAPKKLLAIYALNIVSGFAYILLASMVTGFSVGELLDTSVITSAITSVIILFYNKSYYEARKEMFVN